MTEFDGWAPYYDLVHTGLTGEAEFYVMEGVRCGGPVLELGCGTGRICLPMAMSGVPVTGLDLSSNMLKVCREKLRELGRVPGKLTLTRKDMRHFELGTTFPLIVAPYRTMMHLLTPDDQIRCLENVLRHLSPGGRFIFNVWAAKPSAIAKIAAKPQWERLRLAGEYDLPEQGWTLRHFHAVRYEEARQLIWERHRFEHVADDGKIVESVDAPLTRVWFTPREMEHLLYRCGFTDCCAWGDFEGRPLSENSTEMIWHARRA